MSELLLKIKADQLAARKAGEKQKAATLTTLIGEASKLDAQDFKRGITEVTDDKVLATIKSFADNVRITLQNAPEDRKPEFESELALLTGYQPKQLTEDELRVIITAYKSEGLNIGQVMSRLKAEYTGQYDGKMASALAKA